jgi:hypothetical protein
MSYAVMLKLLALFFKDFALTSFGYLEKLPEVRFRNPILGKPMENRPKRRHPWADTLYLKAEDNRSKKCHS